MQTWVVQDIEALTVCDGRYLVDGDEPLFLDWFANDYYLSTTLHEGGISGVAQDGDE